MKIWIAVNLAAVDPHRTAAFTSDEMAQDHIDTRWNSSPSAWVQETDLIGELGPVPSTGQHHYCAACDTYHAPPLHTPPPPRASG